MLSSIFIALFQAAAGDPAVAATETATAPAASTEAAPRTERRRVCRTYEAGTGGRLSQRRCRNIEVPVRDDTAAADAEPAETSDAASIESTEAEAGDAQTGGAPVAASPTPSPQ